MTSVYSELLAFCQANKQSDFGNLLGKFKTDDLFKFLKKSLPEEKKNAFLLKFAQYAASKPNCLERILQTLELAENEQSKGTMSRFVCLHAANSGVPGLAVLVDPKVSESERFLAAIEYLKAKCPEGGDHLKRIEDKVKAESTQDRVRMLEEKLARAMDTIKKMQESKASEDEEQGTQLLSLDSPPGSPVLTFTPKNKAGEGPAKAAKKKRPAEEGDRPKAKWVRQETQIDRF